MKSRLIPLLIATLLSSTAGAADLYISGQVGEAFGSRSSFYPDPANTPSVDYPTVKRGSNMPTARGAIGLSFPTKSGSWDVELGLGNLGHYQQARDCASATMVCDVAGYGLMASEIDVRGRYWLPLGHGFSLYGEAGIARAHWHQEQWVFSSFSYTDGSQDTGGWVSKQGTSYAPQAGLGVGYDVSSHIRATVGVSETFGVNGVSFRQVGLGVRVGF